MNFAEMTNEEWQEVYRRHDALIQMGQLEMQTEEIREAPRAGAQARTAKPVERELRELDTLQVALQH